MKSMVYVTYRFVVVCALVSVFCCVWFAAPAYAHEQADASSSATQDQPVAVQEEESSPQFAASCEQAAISSCQVPDAVPAHTEKAAEDSTAQEISEVLESEVMEPQKANASPTIDVPAHVRYEQTMAREVFNLVNDLRSNKGLAKLGWNANLEKTATVRAVETTLLYDYERPLGQKNLSAFPSGATAPLGESIEKTYESYSPAAQLFNNLENNPGHNSYILSKQFKSVGIAVVSTRDNGQLEYYISVCYSADASTGAPAAAKDTNATVGVAVPASLVTGIVVGPSTVYTNVGSTVQLPVASISFSGGSFSRTLGNIPYDASRFDWSIGNTGIAALGASGITGKARGTAQGTATLKGTSISTSFTVSVGTWVRLWGDNALLTMKQIALNGFADGSCKTVVLATMSGYWDALSASGLAGMFRCPVLLTDPATLSPQAANEIKRLGASRVIIAGGPAAVSDKVKGEVGKVGGVTSVQRVYGAKAVDTALAIYEEGKKEGAWGGTAIVATVDGYWDALSVSPYSYAQKMPIFLAGETTKSGAMQLDAKTLSTLKGAISSGKVTRVLICGGTAAIAASVQNVQLAGLSVQIVRKAGDTADLTSSQIAQWCVEQGMTDSVVGVATIDGYWDALTGASLCGMRNGPIVLVGPKHMGAVNGYIAGHARTIKYGYVFGGTAAVPESIYNRLVSLTG